MRKPWRTGFPTEPLTAYAYQEASWLVPALMGLGLGALVLGLALMLTARWRLPAFFRHAPDALAPVTVNLPNNGA